MTAADPAKKFQSLLRRLKTQYPGAAFPSPLPESPDEFDPLVHELMFGILAWNAGTANARAAHKRIREQLVDYNEMRVCLTDELAGIIGDKQPFAIERALRLKACTADIFQRQHRVMLTHLIETPKRDARAYLESLEGVPPFASARVAMLRLDIHAAPVDDRLLGLLRQEGCVEEAADIHAATGWLERHVRAGEAIETAALLQAWADDLGHSPKRDKPDDPHHDPHRGPDPTPTAAEPNPKPAHGRKSNRSKSSDKHASAKATPAKKAKPEEEPETSR